MGAISRQSAWMLAYWRGVLAAQLAKTSPMKGGMLAVGLSPEDVRGYLEAVETDLGSQRLVVACLNSHTNVTVSGESKHIDHLQAMLDTTGGIFNRRLKVDVAYHSFQMDMISNDYAKQVKLIEPGFALSHEICSESIVMVSSVTGQAISAQTLCSPQYWARNLTSMVRWTDAMSTMCDLGSQDPDSATTILEVGPHAALQAPSKAIIKSLGRSNSIHYIPLLVRKISAVRSLLDAAGYMHCAGHPVDLALVNAASRPEEEQYPLEVLTTLPEYPFNHSRSYWHESLISRGYRFRPYGWHELLGVPESDWNHLEPKWRHTIRIPDQPWVKDHDVRDIKDSGGPRDCKLTIKIARRHTLVPSCGHACHGD